MEKDTPPSQAACDAAITRSCGTRPAKCRDFRCQAQDSKQGWARPWRAGLYRRKNGDGTAKRRFRPSGNDPSRKQAKQSKYQVKQESKPSKRPRSSCVCSPASPRREARPTRQPGPHQPCAKRRTAQARLRPARVGKAGPRPSQAPSGPRRPQPSLAPSQASGVDTVPAAWSEGLTTGRCRGTDTSPGRVLSEMPCCARHSASKKELGGSSKEQTRRIVSQQ